MKKYSTLKHFSRKLVIGAKVLFGTAGLIFGGNQIVGGIKSQGKEYKSPNQIQQDSEMFNANTLIMGYQPVPTKFNVLLHNGNEPIYYSVSNQYNQREKELIADVLNYYESAFKTINSNYRFKQVSEAEVLAHGTVGKTVVNFHKINAGRYTGASLNYYSLFSPTYINGSTILFDSKLSLNDLTQEDDLSEKKFYQIIFEEVGHTFGLGDVYFDNDHDPIYFGRNNTTDIVHTNTFIQNQQFLRSHNPEFTPTDYAMFQALYNTDHLTGKHSAEYIQNLIKEYKISYFKSRTHLLMQTVNGPNRKEHAELEEFTMPENGIIKLFSKVRVNQETKQTAQFEHIIKFEEDKLIHTIYNQDGKLIEISKSGYDIIDGVVVVTDAFFASGIQPGTISKYNVGGGAYTDYAIVNTNQGLEFVNYTAVNRQEEYSKQAMQNLSQRFATITAEEPHVELLQKEIATKGEGQTVKETYSFTVPTSLFDEYLKAVLLPEEVLKNLKKQEDNQQSQIL